MTGPGGRLAHVRALIADEKPASDDKPAAVGLMQRLCRAAARALPASGVGVSLITDTDSQVTVAASGALTERIEELQFALGEGPCLDAHAARRPVLTSDLLAGGQRWPGYTRAVQDLGVRAVFAFPLQIGAARLGAMDVYRDEVGGLSDDAVTLALSFAEVATLTLLDSQREAGEVDGMLWDAVDNRYEVFQAQGMVMVQLGVPLEEAMVRLRGYAYSRDRRLGEVAKDIVAGRLILEPDEP